MTVHAATAPLPGDPAEAFRLADATLSSLGFRIVDRGPNSGEFAGPGMNSTKESALTGASRISLDHNRAELALHAELGGADRMSRFATYFPIGLALLLGVALSALFVWRFGPGVATLRVALAVGGNAAV